MDHVLSSAPSIEEVMDEVAARLAQPAQLGDGEFTTSMFAQHHSISTDTAYEKLRRGAEAGLLEYRTSTETGRRENIWKFTENGSD